MAERALRLIFNDPSRAGKTVMIRVNKADDTLAGSVIGSAMQAIVDNKEIFVPEIGTIKKAEFLTSMELTPVNLG